MQTKEQQLTSLASRAVLFRLNISTPGNTEIDHAETSALLAKTGAEKGAAYVKKLKIAKHIMKIWSVPAGAMRNYLYKLTTPWDDGLRICAAKLVPAITLELNKFMTALKQAKNELKSFARSGKIRYDTKNELGNLTASSCNLTEEDIDALFQASWKAEPFSDVSDFRLNVPQECLDVLKESYLQGQKDSMQKSISGLYDKIKKVVKAVSEQCHKEKGRIFESLVGNVQELVQILPDLNISNDPAIASLAISMGEMIRDLTTEKLKEDPEIRKSTAAKAAKILDQMSAIM